MPHTCTLRVFTRGDDGGNHLGVITDVTGLTDETMQRIATGLGHSETIFLDRRAGGIPLVRIFTPAAEIPFAGHPLVGAAWIMGVLAPGEVDRVRCGVGEIPFWAEGELTWVETPVSPEVLRLGEEAIPVQGQGLGDPSRGWLVRTPMPYLLLDLGSGDAVGGVDPDFGRLMDADWEGTMVFARAGGRVRARFFAPRLGVPEDPATGSAAAALAAVLRFEGEAAGSLLIDQGEEIGAPSTIHLAWSGEVVSLGGSVRRDDAFEPPGEIPFFRETPGA